MACHFAEIHLNDSFWWKLSLKQHCPAIWKWAPCGWRNSILHLLHQRHSSKLSATSIVFFRLGPCCLVFLDPVETSRCRGYNEHFVAWQKRQPQHIDMHEFFMQLTTKKKMEDTSLCRGKMSKIVITRATGKIHSSMDADWSQFTSRFRQACVPRSHESYFSQRLEQLGQRFSAELLNGLTHDALRWFDRSKSLSDCRCV